jgi:formate-dependent phosphoribosylglycinamide formyltransferase (GAR transformylase)
VTQGRQKVMLLGTGATSLPILKALKDLNFYVGVVGNRPDDICHRLADRSHHEDYSDYETVKYIFNTQGYSYVVPSCSDLSYEVGAQLANELGLCGYDDWEKIQVITNKQIFRAYLKENKLPHPKCVYQNDICPETISDLTFPVIVKPLEADTGKGISVISNVELLDNALQLARSVSRDSQCLVEEFRVGSLHSISSFIINGKIGDTHIFDEYCTDYEFAVNESNFPTVLSAAIVENVKKIIARLISAMHLGDGLLHMQFIVQNENIILIECMRRLPGDFFPKLISHSIGYPYYKNYVYTFVGRKPKTDNKILERKSIARQTITSMGANYLSGISINCSGRVLEIIPLMQSGDHLLDFPASKQAVIFYEYERFDTMVNEVGRLSSFNKVF